MAALIAAKKELRKHLKKMLKDVSDESVTSQSSSITTTLLSLPEYRNASRISVYLSMPVAEVQTAAIVRDALKNGKKVFIPYFYKLSNPPAGNQTSTMDMLELKSVQDYEGLQPDSWGIPTPSEDSISLRSNCFGGKGRAEGEVDFDCETHGLDLIVTPGLGFDRDLGRIGRGMGFYDNFFARCQSHSRLTKSKMPWTIGLALNEQVLTKEQRVPMEETDQQLDALIVGDGSVLSKSA